MLDRGNDRYLSHDALLERVMTTPDIALILVRLEVKLDHLITESSDHELRLRALETRRWPLQVTAVTCSVLSMIVAAVGVWVVQ